jgi:hypothetical protein
MIRAPLILPPNWEELSLPSNLARVEGACFARTDRSMTVIMTREDHNGTSWLHISISRRDRYPTWEEIRFAKDLFIGRDMDSVMILPRKEDYINLHPNCFHLYHRLDGDTVQGNPQRG